MAVELVKRDRLTVLLDGMDEVPQRRREACVEAINAFRGVHGGWGWWCVHAAENTRS